MTKLTKKQLVEKEKRKKQFEERELERISEGTQRRVLWKYEKLWPESRKRRVNIILSMIWYGFLVLMKVMSIIIMIIIRTYMG